ncbi:hypothetical protein CGRA01v4_03611 [Colletotrichum graminicola]|uniref:Uncharacterized protein n=1 Tax=Colletotrichum graminicola (strain M1.001 / M2 / FGSC 10212) TaxID=645133 RepID=E3QG16_COLGM|nr:uncharacterized protein GLRG_04995 [Colletotrichum graminicola M1.001]EFQ29851.1 hypothetical protein GLRG_04995 [Colletotrichum graminicola M1.001]WDK12331.1 hypothetical protein CGRA01v4_03611 [Colletotrichum graminicola]
MWRLLASTVLAANEGGEHVDHVGSLKGLDWAADAFNSLFPQLEAAVVRVIGYSKGLPTPATYLDEKRVPPGIWASLNDVLTDCSRTASLLNTCTKAFDDRRVYPDAAKRGPGFSGPNNVVVFMKWPILAYLVQLWFERKADDGFHTTLAHSDVPGDERQNIIDWFGSKSGSPDTILDRAMVRRSIITS